MSRVRAVVTVLLFLGGGIFLAFPAWGLLLFPAAAVAARSVFRAV